MIQKPVLLDDARMIHSVSPALDDGWNWRMHCDDNIKPHANYYESTLSKWDMQPSLQRDVSCDVLVIGGGILGCSTALHLAENGVDVILVEKKHIGSSASGRNGGQLTPGLARWDAQNMLEYFSHDVAGRLWKLTGQDSMDLIDSIIEKYNLETDRSHGHITAAVHPGHLSELIKSADARSYLGDNAVKVIGKHNIEDYISSTNYYGGAIDSLGGQIHPLALNRGLAYGININGGQIFERSEVTEIQDGGSEKIVIVNGMVVRVKKATVLAVHHRAPLFRSGILSTTMPFHSYIGVSTPMNVPVEKLIPSLMPVYDTRLQIDYYRAVRKNRILFGGHGTGSSLAPDKVNRYLTSRFKKVFGVHQDIAFDYIWSGVSDITINGATDCSRTEESIPTYTVHGWNGHGVAQSVQFGKTISDDILNKNEDFKILSKIGHVAIPFGQCIAPVVIPAAKAVIKMKNVFTPGEMISF